MFESGFRNEKDSIPYLTDSTLIYDLTGSFQSGWSCIGRGHLCIKCDRFPNAF